jgi:hypothetical protein
LIRHALLHFVEASRRTTNGTIAVWVLLVNECVSSGSHSRDCDEK